MSAEISWTLSLVFILLVPSAIAGLTLINTGLGRSRSAAHFMTSSLCVLSIAVLAYFALGYSVEWGPVGFLFRKNNVFANSFVFLVLLSVAISSSIALGAAADRWRLSAISASTVLFATFIYPLFSRFAHQTFRALEARSALSASFLDAGGSGFINVTGGLAALSITWLLGPRHGKYSSSGMPAAIPAHNAVFVLFGCTLAWVGWLGLNAAGAMLYAGSKPEQSALVIINTTLSAAAAALAAAAVTRIRYRRPDASLIANGWMAGLVASSAGCATFKPAISILVGLIAGTLVVFSVEWFELGLKVDDPCGSISVHAVCGLWGLLAVGVFSGIPGQFMAQLVGISTLLGFVFPTTYGLNWVLNRFIPYRVSPDGERQGLDLHELGADAYPEFVVHSDEFMQR
jgi:Amt family ammonium transporter